MQNDARLWKEMREMNNDFVQPEDSQKDAYTVKEIARILEMKERTAYDFCNKTDLFKVRRIGRLLRVNKQSFDEWWIG